MENIWQSFYRVDKSHNRAQGRFGLGLSIVRAIMVAHGRDFGVFNTDDGVVFWIELGVPAEIEPENTEPEKTAEYLPEPKRPKQSGVKTHRFIKKDSKK